MSRLSTTIGQIMVNETLPEDMRDYGRVLNKKALSALLREVAENRPELYRDISHRLADVGRHAAYTTGGFSFGLRHMRQASSAKIARQKLQPELDAIYDDDTLTKEQREKKILLVVGRVADRQDKEILDESSKEGNPLAGQVLSGARGSSHNLARLRGSDLLYTDHRGRVIPLPVLRSFAQGLKPVEYWAGAYGARKGIMDLKFATQDAGFLSKQLNQIVHRGLVVGLDAKKEPDTLRGLPVDVDDDDSEGGLLAAPIGDYQRNTLITPKVLADLRRKGIKRMLVRSPAVGGSADGGVYGRDVGIHEFSRLPVAGENVSLAAAQALSEPLQQAQISSKHTGGVVGAGAAKAISGFDFIDQLVQEPKTFKGGAAHATVDGLVQSVEDAPAGGKHVIIDGQKHYVGSGFGIKVKKGDHVEAGDVISEGTPIPKLIVEHKGIGEGRRYFIQAFHQAFRDAGIIGHRRNIELLARGLINHVRLTGEVGNFAPDDVVPYSAIEHQYKPRADATLRKPSEAMGQYLEKPYLHYTIGTKLRPSMLRDLSDFGVGQVLVHREAPPFQAEMIRGMANLQHDPDWITKMFGSGLKSSLLESVQRGGTSTELSTSFVPGLAKGVNFGLVGKVITPQPEKRQERGLRGSL